MEERKRQKEAYLASLQEEKQKKEVLIANNSQLSRDAVGSSSGSSRDPNQAAANREKMLEDRRKQFLSKQQSPQSQQSLPSFQPPQFSPPTFQPQQQQAMQMQLVFYWVKKFLLESCHWSRMKIL